MMYAKLAIRNIKRCIRDYIVYFITLVFSVSILFSFLSLAFSKKILSLAENMSMLTSTIMALSFVIIAIVGFMTNYATAFIIKKRKREFGTYLLLGMEKGQVIKMFIVENILIGFAAFAAGLVLGVFLFQMFAFIINDFFNNPFKLDLSFSPSATGISMIFFFIMYLFNTIKSGRLVAKMKIVDLINSSRYNEKQRIKNPTLFSLVCLFYTILCGTGCVILYKTVSLTNNSFYGFFILSLLCILGGLYGIYSCLPKLLHVLQLKSKKLTYTNTNLFLINQITSKVNTTGKTMGVLAILLTIALCSLSLGLSISYMYRTNIKYENPFDIAVALDDPSIKDFNGILKYINQTVPVKDYVDYKLYHMPNFLDGKLKSADIIRLSDYNKLRDQLGLDAKKIHDNEFIIHSDTWNIRKEIKKWLADNNSITINGITLTSGTDLLYTEPFEQYRMNGTAGFALVLPDKVCDKLSPVKSRLVATTVSPAPQSLKGAITHFIRKEWQPEHTSISTGKEHITLSIGVKSWSIANGLMGLTTISFGVLYLSLIFFLVVGSILALQQLTDSAEHRYRFNLLLKMGVSKKDIKILIRKQCTWYFLLPVIFPAILTICVVAIVNYSFGQFILVENTIPLFTMISFLLFFIVYGCYFIICYRGSVKNAISSLHSTNM